MRRFAGTRVTLAVVGFGLAGCPPSDTDTGVDPTCVSGTYWEGGDEESPHMHPGADCIACHASGEGPSFTLAGTVMGGLRDEDDCNGVAGVVVRVTDADGVLHELTTNVAGNFFTQEQIPTPYTIELEHEGRTSAMGGAQTEGACGTCHTVEGANGAPGRVLAP